MASTGSEGGGVRPVSVEELVALNEEIAALVRAGSPLEAGLGRSGAELPGNLGRIAATLSERMKRGESLVEALDAEKATIPPLYRAVVEAGARTGNVSAALEGMTRYLRGFADARDAVGLALWYPLVVATLAYILFVGIVVVVAPRFGAAFTSLGLPATRALDVVVWLGRTAWLWWPIWPIALAAIAVAWVRSGRASRFDAGSWTFLGLFPWMRSLVRDYQSAGFAELLALLLENQIAYPKAVTLAAEATGNAALIAEARAIAGDLERGRSAQEAVAGGAFRSFSPMLRWVLAHGRSEGSMVRALRNLAPMYRTRAALTAEKMRVLLPALVIILVGTSATLLYALTLFLPLSGMLNELAGP
ncbi:type II secretion system F family protein [Paludisphaera mucosa]|uniref:Type II secretion system F family protein n=1 Tax=Paludisphaera mucosa TaxID=3030827 RepID=A0ABT6F8V7_9BACT|nr:type II secretion system F family protein [Paludisphaera mucosa]MDG3004023.1 type II secretion system F family protein [Paludisphaera mucosa]